MKKIKLFLIVVSCALVATSCTKQTDSTLKIEKHDDALFYVSQSWSIDAENLDSEINTFMESNQTVGLKIHTTETGFMLSYINIPDPDEPDSEIVCSGSGATFINCVANYIDGHPSCDLVICADEGGNGYYADSFCP